MISKPILDISAEEKEKATFECEVSRTNADVKWFKVRNSSGKVGKKIIDTHEVFTLFHYFFHLTLKKKSFGEVKVISTQYCFFLI